MVLPYNLWSMHHANNSVTNGPVAHSLLQTPGQTQFIHPRHPNPKRRSFPLCTVIAVWTNREMITNHMATFYQPLTFYQIFLKRMPHQFHLANPRKIVLCLCLLLFILGCPKVYRGVVLHSWIVLHFFSAVFFLGFPLICLLFFSWTVLNLFLFLFWIVLDLFSLWYLDCSVFSLILILNCPLVAG